MKILFGLALLPLIIGSPVAAADRTAADRTDITIVAPWEITSVDPAKSGYVLQRLQVMETLVDADAGGMLRPGLATAWTASADRLTWTFTLRDGVRFHDGTSLTAAAAAAALTRAAGQPGVLGKTPVVAIIAGDGTVVFTLEKPFAALPAFLTHSSTMIPAPAAFDAGGRPTRAIGTGPFRVAAIAPPQSLEVTRFSDYWGPPATLRHVRYLAAGRAETRTLMAESGDADLVFTLDAAGFRRLAAIDHVDTVAVPIPRVIALKVNAGHRFLADPRARQALSLATDRAGIAAGIMRFPDSAATQLFPPGLGDWHDPALPALGHDPDRARALLADLGWTPGDDGVLIRAGERFEIVLRTFPDRPALPLIATALQDQWRAVGIALTVSVNNYSEIPAGHQDGSLHVALFARNYGLTPDPISTTLSDFGTGGSDWGSMNWSAPTVARALAAIAATADPAVRAPHITTVIRGLHDGLPMIPIVWYQHTVAVATELDGVVVDPLERSYGLSRLQWRP